MEHGHAVGVTIEGVPVELVVAPRDRFGTALVRLLTMRDYQHGAKKTNQKPRNSQHQPSIPVGRLKSAGLQDNGRGRR